MIWETILQLREVVRQRRTMDFITVSGIGSARPLIAVDQKIPDAELLIDFSNSVLGAPLLVRAHSPFNLEIRSNGHGETGHLAELKIYLPYAILPFYSDQQRRCIAISHSAQTLDGKIASISGDSKWIGNDENLIHAHKMRALCDAVLIGANTMITDGPKLTVRHVTGNNPMRVIIGGDPTQPSMQFNDSGPTMHICNGAHIDTPSVKSLEKVEGAFNCKEILKVLYREGLDSVYIEGGAITTSHFFKQQAIDQVQVHFAPKILGSGKSGFQFDGVDNMEQAHHFDNPRFVSIGTQTMFLGESVSRD